MPNKITLEDVNSIDNITDVVDPTTGLSNKGASGKVSPITVNDLDQIDMEAQAGGSAYLGKGDFGLDPSDYDFQLRYGANNDEIRASSQSNMGMVAKGLGRLGLTTATKFLGGLGYVGTALPALFNGDMSVMLDNGWSETFRNAEEGIKEAMPIYKTQKYLDGNILDQMGTLGFWTDDVVDGAAFMLSSIIGAKGIGALGKGAGAMKGLGTYSKLAKQWSAATRAAKTGKGVSGLGKIPLNLKKVVDKMDLATMTTFNTIGEAAFEAKDVKDSLMQSYKTDIELGRMTAEEANDRASRAAKTTFWTNAAILMPSNFLSMSMMFKTADRLNLDSVFKAGKKAGKTGAEIAGEVSGQVTKKDLAGAFGKNAFLSMMSEGVYEENMQTALQNYVTDRANNKTDDNLIKGLYNNWVENFSTDEGQKSIALGAIIGLIPGGVGGVKEAQHTAKERAATAAARGAVADKMQNNVQDLYERHKIYNEEGEYVGESDAIVVDPVTNKPKIDEAKVAATFQKAYDEHVDFAAGMQALAAGNKNMFNFIRQKQFSNAAFDLLQDEGGAETLNDLIDVYAEQEIEDLSRAGFEGTELSEREAEVRELSEKYRTTAEQLSKIYNSIRNNHGGLANFGKDAMAQTFKNGLMKQQYDTAVEQLYLNDLIETTQQEVTREELSEDSPVSGIKGLTTTKAEAAAEKENKRKVLKGAEAALRDSESRMKDLLSFKKQEQIYKEFRADLAELEASRGGENKDGTTEENPKVGPVSDGVVVSPELTTKTLTKEQAEANGFKEDVERSAVFNNINKGTSPNYFYKTDSNGTTHIIRTDGTAEGNIVSNNKLYTREVEKENGNKATMTHYFINDQLVKSGVRDHESGEFTPINTEKLKKSLGTDPSEANVNQLFYNAMPLVTGVASTADPRVTGQSETGVQVTPISRILDLGEATIDQKSLDAHRADVQKELTEGIFEITEERKTQAKEEAEIKDPSADVLKRTHGDARYEQTTPEQHFANGVIQYIPAIYQNKPGYLSREGSQVIFVPTVHGEKQYIVSNDTSTDTFEELGITALKQVKTDFTLETDGRPYPIKIHGKYYKNPYFSNPADAVEVDANGNPTSVTLMDTKGKYVVLTTPHVVHDIAYALETKEALKDRIFNMRLFGTDTKAVMVADPKTGVSYGVFRVEGTYVVRKANPGNNPSTPIRGNSKIYERVVKELEKQLDNAIGEVSNMNLNANSAEKTIADEFRRYLQNVRAADSGEALSLPDEREVQKAKEATQREVKPEKSVSKEKDTTTDKEIVDEQAKQDAIEAEAQARKEAQDKLARQEQSTLEEGKGTNVETVGKDDAQPSEEEVYRGVHDGSVAVSYVDYNRDTGVFNVRDASFMQHAIRSDLENTAAYPEIDMDYTEFWEKHPKLYKLIKSKQLTEDDITKLLQPKYPEEFNTWSKRLRIGSDVNFNYADVLPIKYKIVIDGKSYDKGIFMHETGYPHISVPQEILKEDRRNNTNAGELAYKKEMFYKARNTRTLLLTSLLKGDMVEILPSDKSVGHPNLGEHKPLKDLIKQIDPMRDLRETTIGAAISDGTIFIDGNNTEVPGEGSRGNVYWVTKDTANGKPYNVKLNPARLTEEHANIVYKALIYSSLESMGLTAKYPDNDVTGDLTNQQVLHFLTVQGKKKTDVSVGNKALSYLRSKRLWTTTKGTIVFGEEEMDIYTPGTKELNPNTKKAFIRWATSNKNYPIDISKLNTQLPQSFSIGSTMKYMKGKDSYNSFILNSGTLNTNLEVVANTKSVMNNPVVSFDTANPKIIKTKPETTPASTNSVQTQGKVNPPQKAPEVVKESKGNQTLDNGKEIKFGVLGETIKNVKDLRDGSQVYFFNPANAEAGITPIGNIGTVEGKRYIVLTDMTYGGAFASLNGFKMMNKVIELTDASKLAEFDKKIGGFRVFLHFDSPSIVPSKPAEVETVKEPEKKTQEAEVQETVKKQNNVDVKTTDRNVNLNFDSTTLTYDLANEASTYMLEFEEHDILGQQKINLIVNTGSVSFKNQDKLSELNEMLKSFLGQEEDVLPKDEYGFALEGIDPKIMDVFVSSRESQEESDSGIHGLDDVDDAPFRSVPSNQGPFKPIKLAPATKWLKTRFKDLDVEVHQGLIELGHNRHAFGQSRLDSILLASAAEHGTEYHEAFHRVSLFLMKDSERKAIYDKARKEYNKKDATNKEIEEVLAEKFREHVIAKEENIPTTVKGKIKAFLDKVWNYIMSVFVGPGRLTDIEIEELFRRIENGRFRYTSVDPARTKELEGRYANFEIRDVKFQHIQTDVEYREVIQNLFYQLVESNGLITRKTVDGKRIMTVNYNSPADLKTISYETFKHSVAANLKKYKDAAAKETDPAKKAVATRIANIYGEVVDNWGVIYEDMKDFMVSLNINTIREDSDLKEFDEDTGENKSEFDQYNKVSFESSSKDNTAATIKLLMSILPESNVRSELTGLYKFAEFGPTWSKLLIDNLGVVEPSDMMMHLEAKAKSHLPYQILLRFLNSNPNLKAQFFTTVKQSRLDFVNAYFQKSNTSFDMFFGDAVVRSATKSTIKDWNTTFNRNPELFTQKKGEKVKPNTEAFKNLQEDFKDLYQAVSKEMNDRGELRNFVNSSNKLKDILSATGITLTNDQFDYILLQSDPKQDAALLKLMQNHLRYIYSPEGTLSKLFDPSSSRQGLDRKITFANAFTNESGIQYLAEKAAMSDPLALGDTTLGPAGKLYYLVTQHTYLTNEIDRLKKDPAAEATKKLKAKYNENSVYLKAMLEDPTIMQKFSLKTLSSVVREGTRDVGREYKKITDLEEYIIRMAANFRGYVTPPTPGDRSSYQYLKGFPTLKLAFDGNFNWNSVPGELDIIGTFKGYLDDEIARIKHTKQQVDDAIAGEFDWKQLVENLHFTVPKGTHKGQEIKSGEVWLDNGEVKTVGKLESSSMKLLKKGSKYVGRGTQFTNFEGVENYEGTKDEIIVKILNDRLGEEMQKALAMGVIAKNADGKYYNVLIPESIMTAMADRTGINNTQLQTTNAIADYMINTMMANIEMGKVFTADPASFASQDDYVKRLTGYTSTGSNLYTEFPTGYYKNDELITASTYTITTFTSHLIRSKYYDDLVQVHTEWNLKAGIAKNGNEARAIAEDKLKNLLYVDQTDAQTFITPEMYRALSIKLGEWSDQKEEAYQLLTDNSFDFDKMDDLSVINAYQVVMQPLKTTYMKTNQNDGQSYSVFDKMSMSTLFRPMIKGTQLEDLLNRMEATSKYEGETPIHHVKFHTAEKAGRRDRRDFFTDETEETLNLENLSTYSQDFDHLRKQLVTDPHDVRTIMFGSQAKKIGISNVQFEEVKDKDGNVLIDNKYQNVFDEDEIFTGRELVKEVHDMLSEISHRGVEKFKKDFRLGDDYSIIDKTTLAEKMKNEARKANLPQYVVDSFKIDPLTKDFYVDFDSIPGARKWVQTRIISLIKKATIDVNIPGNSFIQMSNIGLRKTDLSEDLKFIAEEGLIEAAVSVNLFKHAIPNFAKKSHAERVKFLEANPQLTSMAYRVPTQGQNSTYMLKIVRFLEEQIGDTVILPAEGTAIGGFDFDIDKLYMVRHNYKNGKKIKYLTKKNSTKKERMELKAREELADEIRRTKALIISKKDSVIDTLMELTDEEFESEFARVSQAAKDATIVEVTGKINDWIEAHEETFESLPLEKQNIEEAVQNRLLDMYHSVWQNKKHEAHRTQPLGYAASQLENLADFVTSRMKTQDVKGAPLSTVTPSFQLNIKSKFKFGAEGLGPNALANVHQILGQYVGLGLHRYLGIGNSVTIGEEGSKGKRVTDFSALLGRDNEYITEWFSALIDAHVDIAANPYISKLNANPYTNDVITLLIRAGVGGHETFKFIAQPALQEAARLSDNRDNRLDVKTGNPINTIYTEYLKHYSALSGETKPSIPKGREAVRKLFNFPRNFDKSFEDYGNKNFDANYYMHQLMVLEAFKFFQQPATKLKEAILSSRVDTKKIGNTLIDMIAYEARSRRAYQDDLDQTGVRNYIKLYENTYLGALTDNSLGIAKPAIGSLLMEGKPAFRFLHANLLDLLGGRYSSDEKLIGKIADEIYVNVAASFFKKYLKNPNEEVSRLLRGDNSIPKRIYDIRRKDSNHPLKNNALIKLLSPIFEQDRPDFLYHNKPDDKWHKDSIVRAWKDLISGEGLRRLMPDGSTAKDIETAKWESKALGEDLFVYSYLTSGFKPGVFSFFDYIPREVLVATGYDRFIKAEKKKMDNPVELDWMLDEIFLNNWQDSDFVPQVGSAVIDQSIKDDTVLKLKGSLSNELYYGENKHGEDLYRPYIKTGTGDEVRLYRYGGYVKKNGDPIYYEVHKKSYYNQGYVLRENMFDITGFSSNKIKSKDDGIVDLLQDPYEVLTNLGVPIKIVDDLIPAKYSEYKDEVPSEVTKNEDDINPIASEGVGTDLDTEISNTIGTLISGKNIPTNFYTLKNGNIVFIENLGKDEIGYLYDIEHYFNKRPSKETIRKRKQECK